MKKIATLIISMVTMLLAQNLERFPLWGTNWVIAEGINKKVYPSIIPLQPKKLVSVQFKEEKDSVVIEYANYMHRQYAGSWDVIKDFNKQVSQNRIAVPYDSINTRYGVLNIQYQPYDDSVWSLHKAIIEKCKEINEIEIYVKCGTIDTTFTDIIDLTEHYESDTSTGVWSTSKPYAYITRAALAEDINNFQATGQVESSDGYEYYFSGTSSEIYGEGETVTDVSLGSINIDNSVAYQDYMKVNPKTGEKIVYDYIWDYEVKTDNLGYWQIHVHPEKWFFPIDIDNGKPLIRDEYKKTYKDAEDLRQQYINDRSKFELKYWANPYFCDSLSVISSFAFINTPGCKDKEWIWLSGMSEGTKVEYEHTPDRMFRWVKGSWDLSRSNVIRKLYTKEGAQEKLAKTLYTRCPGWMSKDELNGKELFKKKWIYPKIEDKRESRLIWSGSGLPIGGNKAGTIKAIGHTWERDWDQLDNIFVYNNCPCSKMSDFGDLTKAQLTKFIYYPIRTCSLLKLRKELRILSRMHELLNAIGDRKNISEKMDSIRKIIKKKEKIYYKKGYVKDKEKLESSYNSIKAVLPSVTNPQQRKALINNLKHIENKLKECNVIINFIAGYEETRCMKTWVDRDEFKYF